MPGVVNLFRAHVQQGAHARARLRDGYIVFDFGNSKIKHLNVPVFGNEQVRGLDVAMNNIFSVCVLKRIHKVIPPNNQLFIRELLPVL